MEEGDFKASIEVLKAVGMYGDGTMNAIGEQDPEAILTQQAKSQVKREGILENAYTESLIDLSQNPNYRRRLDEVKAALETEYLDGQP